MKIALTFDEVVGTLLDDAPRGAIAGAIDGIKELRRAGHKVAIVTPYPFYNVMRQWLKDHDLQWLPAYVGIGHVAGFCRDNGYDMLVTAHLPYAKGADTVGLFSIYVRREWWGSRAKKWGMSATKKFGANSWKGVLHFVSLIANKQDSWHLAQQAKEKALEEQARKGDWKKLERILEYLEEIEKILEE